LWIKVQNTNNSARPATNIHTRAIKIAMVSGMVKEHIVGPKDRFMRGIGDRAMSLNREQKFMIKDRVLAFGICWSMELVTLLF
jgi:hypothetical protein